MKFWDDMKAECMTLPCTYRMPSGCLAKSEVCLFDGRLQVASHDSPLGKHLGINRSRCVDTENGSQSFLTRPHQHVRDAKSLGILG